MLKKSMFVILLFSFFIIYSEDIVTTPEQNISLTSEESYGCIILNWELHGIPEFEKLELKILDRVGNQDETISVKNRTSYILDRNFQKDDEGNFKEISVWLVATIQKSKKIGMKYYKTGTTYLASNLITKKPLDYPSPEYVQFTNGKLTCRFILANTDLTNRFYGFKVDGREIKLAYNPYGNYSFSVNKQIHPAMISALFTSTENPILIQASKPFEILKADNEQLLTTETDCFFEPDSTFFETQTSDLEVDDNFELSANYYNHKSPNYITISWKAIKEADQYYVYRIPSQDHDNFFRSINSNSKLLSKVSGNNNRLQFNNSYHTFSAHKKEELKSKRIYTYWINAQKLYGDLGTSQKLSIYYCNESNLDLVLEVKGAKINLNALNDYPNINSTSVSINSALLNKNYEKYVSDFQSEADSISFNYSYVELKPYRFMESDNDGYVSIYEVIRVLLPSRFQNDVDLFALMKVINFDASTPNKKIGKTKILTDDFLKIPIPTRKAVLSE